MKNYIINSPCNMEKNLVNFLAGAAMAMQYQYTLTIKFSNSNKILFSTNNLMFVDSFRSHISNYGLECPQTDLI